VAEINRKNHGLEERLYLIESDLFESLPEKRRPAKAITNQKPVVRKR